MPPTASTPVNRAPWSGRLLVLGSILASAFNLRTAVTSLTPLLDVLGEVFHFGASFAGVLGMVPTAAFAAFGVATPRIAHRLGLERTAHLAMLLAMVGLLLRSFALGPASLLVASAISLAGMGMGNVVLPPLVKRYFPDRVGTVSSAYITILQIGTLLPALLAVPVAEAAGWRVSLGTWTVAAAAAASLWWAVRRVEARTNSTLATLHHKATERGDPAPEMPEVTDAPGKVWRTKLGWGMALMFGMTSLNTYAMFTWLPRLLTEAGATPSFAGTMVALFSALGLVGALCMPLIAVRIRNPYPVVVICTLFYAAAFLGLLWAPMQAPVLWVALLGMGPSTFPLTLTLINLRTRTQAGSAALSGFMQGVGYTVSCLGPLLFGVLHEASGGWELPFAFLASCVGVLLAGAWFACKPQVLEDHWLR
jgi:CP family cyanate transporter-like MFS transporter